MYALAESALAVLIPYPFILLNFINEKNEKTCFPILTSLFSFAMIMKSLYKVP